MLYNSYNERKCFFVFNLIIILISTLNSEPKDSNNYKIAKYIIDNITTLENCTLTELAKKCYVSNSSISRFCTDIGLEDFNALKNQITQFPYAQKIAREKFNFKEYDSHSLSKSYIESVTQNLNTMNTASLDKDIKKIVKDIQQYDKIAVFGYLQSTNIALDLQYDLQTNRKIVFTRIKFKEQVEYIRQADEHTLLIIFSDSGTYFDRVFQRMQPFKDLKHKPKICMITSSSTQSVPYIDHYIRYNGRNDYATHPFPMMVIAKLICLQYAKSIE